MKPPDWSYKFILNPNTSTSTIACVLIQNDDAGRAHPIYYASCLMSAYKQKYSDVKKLALAVLLGCVKFKHYIIPSEFPTEVQSPREGLKNLLGQLQPVGRATRLILNLQQYDLYLKVERGQRA